MGLSPKNITDVTIDDFVTCYKDAQSVFIADLHLDEQYTQLNTAFIQLLQNLQTTRVKSLYILGDWFDGWIGDDIVDDPCGAWLLPIITELQKLQARGVQTYFCTGNRDFALGKQFLQRFGGKLLKDVSYVEYGYKKYRLEHGDLLCTDDVSYQRFRKVIRNPLVMFFLRKQSITKRKRIAENLRQKSKDSHKKKTMAIMDVNADAVAKAMHGVDAIIHGHTHRPAQHEHESNTTRYVLGDWRYCDNANNEDGSIEQDKDNKPSAVIGVFQHNAFELVNITF